MRKLFAALAVAGITFIVTPTNANAATGDIHNCPAPNDYITMIEKGPVTAGTVITLPVPAADSNAFGTYYYADVNSSNIDDCGDTSGVNLGTAISSREDSNGITQQSFTVPSNGFVWVYGWKINKPPTAQIPWAASDISTMSSYSFASSGGGSTGGSTSGGGSSGSTNPLGTNFTLMSDSVNIFTTYIVPAVVGIIIAVYLFRMIVRLSTRYLNRA